MGESAGESHGPRAGSASDTPDLLRVALAAYAAHLAKRARLRIPVSPTPWGRSARNANLRRWNAR